MEVLSYNKDSFLLNDKPFTIISGAIHYFRVHPEYWYDRLLKLKACGFNTVETYVAWNLHEPEENEYCFDGFCDIVRFIEIADELGLKVIVRPGPYICAEWDFGGFPYWINKDKNMRIRCNYKSYLEKVDRFFSVLLPKLVPYLSTKGGPIIAMQVENEYGSYGNDKEYLLHIEKLMIKLGIDCLLFTSDGWVTHMLSGGTLPHLLKTVNFGSKPKEAFAELAKVQPYGPNMCCEFWDGWFEQWGKDKISRSPKTMADDFETMITMGASVNTYMFHGGTNFGFMNGANQEGDTYYATATTYDYDALLTESGDITEKYLLCKDIIKEQFGTNLDIEVKNTRKYSYGKIELTHQASLFDILDEISMPVKSAYTQTMEEIGSGYGYILYTTTINRTVENEVLEIKDICDRATIYLNQEYIGTQYRSGENEHIFINVKEGESACLQILVENMGRVNYGSTMGEQKGITNGVLLSTMIFNWEMRGVNLKSLPISFNDRIKTTEEPCFYQGVLNVDEKADTFLDMRNFKKGVVLVNRFNLGRYWNIGPTYTLFLPAPLLKQGENTITVFETDGCICPTIESVDKHIVEQSIEIAGM